MLTLKPSLHEKCPNAEFLLARIFLYSVRIQQNTKQKKLRILTFFTECMPPNHLIMAYNCFKILFALRLMINTKH